VVDAPILIIVLQYNTTAGHVFEHAYLMIKSMRWISH